MRLGAQVAGRYRLTEGPVRGGAGEIWLAHDEELGRPVVLKRALLGDDSAPAFDRLRAEARALARFSHPHVVTLYDAVRVRTRTRLASWLVLEYVPGGSLDRWPRISPESAAHIGAQIAEALVALHAEGIVHCDVKPGNIVVTEKGTAKLTDFGAAYRIDGRKTVTPNGAISHTPAYAAPEVIRARPEPASDVFSLGVTIAALITGKPVRGGVSGAADLGHLETAADAGPVREVLAAMLRPAPADRPDAAEARRSLLAVAGTAAPELPLHAIPTLTGLETRPPEPGPESYGGGPALWRELTTFAKRGPRRIAGVAVAVALVAGLALTPLMTGHDHHVGANRPPATPAGGSVIGEPRTADPCALTDPAPLGRYGRTEVDDDYGNFNRCDVLIHTGAENVVDVEVDLDSEPGPDQTTGAKTVEGIAVIADRLDGDECSRTLLLSPPDGDTNVTVTAKRNGKGSAPLCEVADVATLSAAKALGKGRLARRSPPLPVGSLAHHDACALLDAGALKAVPGIDAREVDAGFAGWDCRWSSTSEDIQVNLRFDRNQPLTSDDGRLIRLSGYRAFVQPRGDGDDTCVAQTVYRTYIDRSGDQTAELLYLVVQGAPSTTRLCSITTGLARSAAAALRQA
ncbi:serine/threonine protein kinase [Actinoallomurus sp. NBC_01490]|uniref:serine/threonine-protein kinase n=1 Tax=Actinoallomurus sp. NBC_01490 TaxID=2903557 RepID=UPI002E3820F4|nr:serine/threonine-protein kinase [Actinoallomurus sp. NBC_01490]